MFIYIFFWVGGGGVLICLTGEYTLIVDEEYDKRVIWFPLLIHTHILINRAKVECNSSFPTCEMQMAVMCV